MTVDEIKQSHSMLEVAESYGMNINRAGFCSCPFHKGDHTASMKIYKDSFHCFGCGASGDIFSFVQKMDGCDFKTAFYSLGGTYEKPTRASEIAIYHAQKAREKKQREQARLKEEFMENNRWIGIYVTALKLFEPFSEMWCFCQNKLMIHLYHDEEIQKQLEGSGKV